MTFPLQRLINLVLRGSLGLSLHTTLLSTQLDSVVEALKFDVWHYAHILEF